MFSHNIFFLYSSFLNCTGNYCSNWIFSMDACTKVAEILVQIFSFCGPQMLYANVASALMLHQDQCNT